MLQGLSDLFDVTSDSKRALLLSLGLLDNRRLQLGKLEVESLSGLLQSARVHCLSKIELYFLRDATQLTGPLNLRNEAAAVSLLLAFFAEAQAQADAAAEAGALLAELIKYSETLWPELASGDTTLSSGSSSGGSGSASGAGGAGAGVGGTQQAQHAQQEQRGVPAPPGSTAALFEGWAREQGVQAEITLASFGALRGCAATRDVRPGETLLSIPAEVLIYEDTVRQTDLGRMLHAIPGLTIDNLLIIFTMIDRHDEDSKWAPYWRSLPNKYFTGLSFPQDLVADLAGTAAQLELTRAQAHLRQQYAATQPLFEMLLTAYPQFLKAQWFDYDCYLWAAELWYSYAFELEFPEAEEAALPAAAGEGLGAASAATAAGGSSGGGGGGSGPGGGKAAPPCRSAARGGGKAAKARRASGSTGPKSSSPTAAASPGGDASNGSSRGSGSGSSKPTMVPFACHINHSPWPHCVRYGRVNPVTRRLDYPAFRPCQEGQQVFISYGPVPNLKLLCYYGFVVPNNPHDLVPLQLEIPEGPVKDRQLAVLEALGISLEHSLQDGPLSKQLLACLRVIVATSAELQQIQEKEVDPLEGPVNAENEEQALATLKAALEGMLGPMEQLPLLAQPAAAASEAGHGEPAACGNGSGGSGSGQADGAAGAEEEEQQQQQQQEQQQLEQLHLDQQGAAAAASDNSHQQVEVQQEDAAQHQQQQQMEKQEQGQQVEEGRNENGFDADWRMSRHFCRVYLKGQRAILRRSLQECTALVHQAD